MRRPAAGVALALALAGAVLPACNGKSRLDGGAVQRGPAPAYESVAAEYNERAGNLAYLKANATLVVTSGVSQGGTSKDQVEASLLVEQPRNVALRVTKVGETLFFLGSNSEQYWWLDLTQDEHTALVGGHTAASPAKAAEFGLPVHPLDLMDVLSLAPLPSAGRVRWSENGKHLVVTVEGRWGRRQFELDPETYEPAVVRLFDSAGATAVEGTLTRYQDVPVTGNALVRPRMPGQINLTIPSADARAVMTVTGPENPGKAGSAAPFDLEGLQKRFKVVRVVNLDE